METSYKPFPNLVEWALTPLDYSAVDKRQKISVELSKEPPVTLAKAREIVTRMAAIETGAIENLYENDRGFTITAAMQAAALESLLKKNQQKKHALIASQIRAYDSVLDFVTGRRPLAEAWIRQLHDVICSDQETYTTYAESGEATQAPLPKGQYKIQDNRVQTRSGIHNYASALDTPAEMARFIQNITSQEFERLHPVDQATYIHFCLVAVHPFADGNGRIARALTSVPTYRHYSVPILISVDHRDAYFDSLASADQGRFDGFRLFVRDRIVESVDMLHQSVRTAKAGSPQDSATRLANLLITRGGFSQLNIDEAGDSILQSIHDHLESLIKDLNKKYRGPQFVLSLVQKTRAPKSDSHRQILSRPPRMIQLQCLNSAPANASAVIQVAIAVPRNAGSDDYFAVECGHEGLTIEIPISQALPKLSLISEMRTTMFAEEVTSKIAEIVETAARAQLIKQGFELT